MALLVLSLKNLLILMCRTCWEDWAGVVHPRVAFTSGRQASIRSYYTAIRSLYRHVVCDVPVSCKANGERNQRWAWLDSDPNAD